MQDFRSYNGAQKWIARRSPRPLADADWIPLLAASDRKLIDPSGIDLMSGVVIGDTPVRPRGRKRQ